MERRDVRDAVGFSQGPTVISVAPPFGRLCCGEHNSTANATECAGVRPPSPDAHVKDFPLLCGKCPIAAVSGPGGVGAHEPEMICGARGQARDVRD